MTVVVSLHITRRHLDERIGNGRELLAGPLARERFVGGLDTAGDLQRIDVNAALHQSEVLLHLALQTGLLVELRPGIGRLGVGLGLREELADGSHAVLAVRGSAKAL